MTEKMTRTKRLIGNRVVCFRHNFTEEEHNALKMRGVSMKESVEQTAQALFEKFLANAVDEYREQAADRELAKAEGEAEEAERLAAEKREHLEAMKARLEEKNRDYGSPEDDPVILPPPPPPDDD